MKLSKEYLIEYFAIYGKLLQLVSANVLNDFDLGKLDHMTQSDFSTDKLLFLLEHHHIEKFKENNPEIYKEIQYTVKNINEQSVSEINSMKDLVKANNNSINDKFKNLSFSPINSEYSWGKFGEFNVVMCLKNAYINGSVLIEEGIKYENNLRKNLGKRLLKIESRPITNWFENDCTKVLFNTLASKYNLKELELYFSILGKQKKGEEMLQGTFIHPLLANVLAEWVSPSYALIVSEIMSDIHIKSKEKQDNLRIFELEQTIIKKDYKIKDLFKRLDDTLDKNEKIANLNLELMERNSYLAESLKESVGKLRNAVGFIDEHKDEIRLPSTIDNMHHIYVYFIEDNDGYKYYKVYRRKSKDIDDFFTREEKKYMTYKREYYRPVVNAIQVWCTFRENNIDKLVFINSSTTRFVFVEDYTFKDFLTNFKEFLNTNILKVRNIF